MVRYQDEDEREEISWREIDRRRDRSPHAPKEHRDASRKPSRRSEWMKKQYRKEAEKLFMGKKGTEKHHKARNAMHTSHGTDRFDEIAKNYLDEYGLPDDWSTLSILLDLSDTLRVLEVLRAMKEIFSSRSPVEQQGFKSKLDILAMTATDPDLRDLAEETLKIL